MRCVRSIAAALLLVACAGDAVNETVSPGPGSVPVGASQRSAGAHALPVGPANPPAPIVPAAPPSASGTAFRMGASIPAGTAAPPHTPVFRTDPPPGGWPIVEASHGCPSGMARVKGLDDDFCIQRFEASLTVPLGWLTPHDGPVQQPRHVRFVSQAGRVPTHGMSWYQAASACLAYGYHLCTSQEWEDACDGTPGPGGRAHPVADGVRPDVACNIRHGQDGAIAASGRSPECHTPEGVYDLEGNLWEWVDPQRTAADGTPVTDKRGGGFYSGDTATCGQAAVGGHAPTWDGTIGFRCCAAVQDDSATTRDGPVPSGG